MVKIVADTSTLISPKEGESLGIDIIPLGLVIQGKAFLELDNLTSDECLELIEKGGIPSSSQPAIGRIVEVFEKYPEEEVLGIFLSDGLSGTYASAKSAADMVESSHIHVLNSETLCGPHRYLVRKAKALADEGKNVEEILEALKKSMANTKSFLLPQDFEFLRRGGRLTPLAAKLGGLLKIVPIMTLTEDHRRLEKHGVGRTFKVAVGKIIDEMVASGVDENYYVSVTYAGNLKQGEDTYQRIQNKFPDTEIELLPLTPAFIAQGGPGCIAIQWIKK